MLETEIFCLSCKNPEYILVVGSNLAGVHGRSAALQSKRFHEAKSGIGEGISGST